MRAQNHDFVGLFTPANFRDGVEHLHRFFAERIGHFDLDLDGTLLQQPENHPVVFAGHERRRNCPFLERLPADVRHVQESMRLPGIPQNHSDSLFDKKLRPRARHFFNGGERRGLCRLTRARRRLLHGP